MVIFQTTLTIVIVTLAGVATWLGIALIRMRSKMKFYRRIAIKANYKARKVGETWQS